ncbi:MAG TPA: twin-arginine translocation signal domain-containing protein [Kofleriaceae bacterium]|nr:twin-arginine translocation signal domain-containing protein [Kofleriaceae bacterium]
MKKHDDSPPEDFMKNCSRRRFLTGAGASALAVGASALTLPFLRKSAHAQSAFTPPGSPTDNPPSCSDVVNIPSPNPWFIRGCCTDTVCGYNAAGITVTGVRHYCGQDRIPWGDGVTTNVGGTPFPDRPDGASFCLTVYPIVDKLLKRNAYANTSGYDDDLEPFFRSFQVRDMVSCWHEVANLSAKSDLTGHVITAADARAMQHYMLNFRNNLGLTRPNFGAIECPANTNGSTDFGIARCKPFMIEGLDFYGQDLYHKNFGDPTEPLKAWDKEFGSGSTYTPSGAASTATIAVAECNCETPSLRAKYFNDAAFWLWNQNNKGARCFLTFWNYSPGPNESGPWLPGDTATIAALKAIGNGQYSNP